MALEKIEESIGLLGVLRDSVNFYLSYLNGLKKEREAAIKELGDIAAEVDQMNLKIDQAESELGVLREEQGRIDGEFDSVAPYVQLLSKIDAIKGEIAERQKALREREEALVVRERMNQNKPEDDIARERLRRDQAIFQGEKTTEDLIIQRLSEDLTWYSKRLSDAGADTREIEKQARAIQVRQQKIIKVIADKSNNLKQMNRFVRDHQEQIDRIKSLTDDLHRHDADIAGILEVAKIISEVPFNVQPVAAEPA